MIKLLKTDEGYEVHLDDHLLTKGSQVVDVKTEAVRYLLMNALTAQDLVAGDACVNCLVVCDGWTEPRHPRKVLKDGDPAFVSHGMCPECEARIG